VTAVETFANQPTTTVSSGGTTAPAQGTPETWTVASSSSFPAANSGATPPTQFHVADTATGRGGEIIAATLVSGTTWTVTRGAESTTPVAHSAGFTIVQVVSAGALGGMLQSGRNLSDVTSTAAAYNTLSPMTTTGDIEYESGAATASRLAGNTSATMAVLTQAGTGAVSAAPAWAVVNAASSVPALDSAQRLATPPGVSYANYFTAAPAYLLPSPPPVSRRPEWRPATTFAQLFQTGHGWTATGSGVSTSNLNDTSTFIKGTQCATITTAGNAAQANFRSPAFSAVSMTGGALRLTFKIDDVTHLDYITFYLGSSSFTNFFLWQPTTHSASAQNYVQSGEWVTMTVPWANVQSASGSYSVSSAGVPSTTTGFTCAQFAVHDDGAAGVTVHLQAVEIIADTVNTFPGGVVSVVFDDSYEDVFTYARPKMDSYGYRGTLYTIASSIGAFGSLTVSQMQQLQTISGWEIAGHAYSLAAHNAGYDTLTALQVEDEMRYMRAWMLSNGFPADNFAYPQGNFSQTTDGVPIDQICGQYFSTGRSIISEVAETFPPAMPFRVRSKTGISSAGTAVSLITATGGPLDRCQLDGSWYIITLHDVITTTVTTSTQISQTDFTTLMDAINSRSIPVLPVGDVIRYYS
jgi:peptidoglycan/xylan/chitin deacetylase (PgdA/CDA1 family)